MEISKALDYVRKNDRGVLATKARDGTPQLSPVTLAVVDDYRALRGEHPDWDDYRRAMTEDQRCLVRFHITKAGPDKHG